MELVSGTIVIGGLVWNLFTLNNIQENIPTPDQPTTVDRMGAGCDVTLQIDSGRPAKGPKQDKIIRGRVCKQGKVSKNPFFNFIREVRKDHCGEQQKLIVKEAAQKWRRMNCQQKCQYRQNAIAELSRFQASREGSAAGKAKVNQPKTKQPVQKQTKRQKPTKNARRCG